MKRTLAITLSALALAATAAQAQSQAPQPSFVDYATIEASVPSRSNVGERGDNVALPQPSFVDYAVVTTETSRTQTARTERASAGSTMATADYGFPQPSFRN